MGFVGTKWNSADKASDITLSDGDLTVSGNSSGFVRTVDGKSSGKWYWEITISARGDYDSPRIGIATIGADRDDDLGKTDSWVFYGYDATKSIRMTNSNSYFYCGGISVSDIIGTALDLDAGKIWWSINGVWCEGGDPAAGTGEAYSGISGTIHPAHQPASPSSTCTANFGNSALTYSPPSGFTAGFGEEVPPPTAAFTSDKTSGEIPLTINFTDQTTGNVTSWSWSFGDGGDSELQNPSYEYTKVGIYTVVLTATGPGGSSQDSGTITAMPVGISGFGTYRGKHIFTKIPHWSENPQENFYRKDDVFAPIGFSFTEEVVSCSRYKTMFKYSCHMKSHIAAVNEFFDYHLGQLVSLWFPSSKNDFILTSDIGATDTTLNIEDVEYNDFYSQLSGTGHHIFIYVNVNTWFARKIVGAPTSTSLLIDEALGVNVLMSQVKMISILYLGRFDMDEIEWTYITPDVASTKLSFVELPEEYV